MFAVMGGVVPGSAAGLAEYPLVQFLGPEAQLLRHRGRRQTLTQHRQGLKQHLTLQSDTMGPSSDWVGSEPKLRMGQYGSEFGPHLAHELKPIQDHPFSDDVLESLNIPYR